MLSRQVFRYVIVGMLGTIAHLAVLVIFVEIFGYDAITGAVAGFLSALSISYVLNHYWTFQSLRRHLSSFWRYAIVSLAGLILNVGMMYALVVIFNWWYFVAQLSVILVVPVCNFLLNRYWAFAAHSDPHGQSDS